MLLIYIVLLTLDSRAWTACARNSLFGKKKKKSFPHCAGSLWVFLSTLFFLVKNFSQNTDELDIVAQDACQSFETSSFKNPCTSAAGYIL